LATHKYKAARLKQISDEIRNQYHFERYLKNRSLILNEFGFDMLGLLLSIVK
jgi:hypothetical protein